jgi:phytoene dehydrogenase-like protein
VAPPAPAALVAGSGPNGLAAAIVLARAGVRVTVLERAMEPGGGLRTLPLTLPGFLHDHCSAIHPLAAASPLFQSLPLAERGLRWARSPAALAHPFDDGTAALLLPSVADTGATLGSDARAWADLLAPLVDRFTELVAALLGPPLRLPRHPRVVLGFGPAALAPAGALARLRFRGPRARALLAGLAAHAGRPLSAAGTSAFGLLLGAAGHSVGWPFPVGGAGQLAAALVAELGVQGGIVRTGIELTSLDAGPPGGAILLDLAPRSVLRVAGPRLPPRYARRLGRYRHGPGAIKLDWALGGPIPWRAPECALAATVHLGGSLEEIARAESDADRGHLPERPFVLLVQHTPFDPTRAPPGRHTAWAYAHVPRGWDGDAAAAAAAVEAQVERFAPGFRSLVLARAVRPPLALEAENPNLVGGDVGGGENALDQLWTRPVVSAAPWRTPVAGLFLCSAATPPGGGVHGMCGYHAARAALTYLEPRDHAGARPRRTASTIHHPLAPAAGPPWGAPEGRSHPPRPSETA